MLRWLGALLVLTVITGLLASGVVAIKPIGIARTLFTVFSIALACSLVVGILRWR